MQPIILITDGSKAAVKAEQIAFDLAKQYNVSLKAVYVISAGWESLIGDEWINTEKNRLRFFQWLIDGLNKRANEVLEAFSMRAQKAGVNYETEIAGGQVEKVIIDLSRYCKVLVLPHLKETLPRAEGGLKYSLNRLIKNVKCPIVIGGR